MISTDKHPAAKLREARELLVIAKQLGRDSDLRIFHRFDKLRVFHILRLQRRLADMTRELEKSVPSMKNIDKESDINVLRDKSEKLDTLIQNIDKTLKEYGMQVLPAIRSQLTVSRSGPMGPGKD
jgi:hypothetical protein